MRPWIMLGLLTLFVMGCEEKPADRPQQLTQTMTDAAEAAPATDENAVETSTTTADNAAADNAAE